MPISNKTDPMFILNDNSENVLIVNKILGIVVNIDALSDILRTVSKKSTFVNVAAIQITTIRENHLINLLVI